MHNRTNYHSHCNRCDGRADMEHFLEEAVRQGFTAYGVSSHAPLPFPARWTLDADGIPAYLEEAAQLKAQYSDRIEFYVGLEIDYLDKEHNPASPRFQTLPLDYRIGSVHLLHDETGEAADLDCPPETFRELLRTRFGNDLQHVVLGYFDKTMEMVAAGGFDFVGHVDKISRNAAYCRPGVTRERWYRDKLRDCLALISEKRLPVEVNTKAYRTAGLFFPNREHFPLLKSFRIPVIVNSDAHDPEKIDDGRPEALQALREAGIPSVLELHRGRWEERPIL